MRWLFSTLGGLAVLVALWPAVCMGSDDEGGNALGALATGAGGALSAADTSSCQSAVFLDLPWGDAADTWGIVAALGGAVAAFGLMWLLVGAVQRRKG